MDNSQDIMEYDFGYGIKTKDILEVFEDENDDSEVNSFQNALEDENDDSLDICFQDSLGEKFYVCPFLDCGKIYKQKYNMNYDKVEMFYLNTIEQLLLLVEQLD